MSKAKQVVEEVRKAFGTGKTLPLSFRKTQLRGLLRMYNECRDEINTALLQDLRKPKMEGSLYETEVLKADTKALIRNLEKWTKPEKVPRNALAFTDSAYVQKDPLGVVLIIGTWNYPFNMIFAPLAGAIAAGNCAVVKPSEMSAHSSATIAKIMPRYLDKDCYKVFEGEIPETIELLKEKFDHIFYTGSSNVGKSIMEAASKHLTPVTLELGGKRPALNHNQYGYSPVYIHDDVNIERAARRVLWGKFVNAGQTCIAPDYVLMSRKLQPQFLDAAKKILVEHYGINWKESKDLARIINVRHFQRLTKILDSTKGRVVIGGDTDESDLWISPTIVVDIDPETDSTMEEEIFGPILPIISADSLDAAVSFILNRPKPLALYVFSNDTAVVQKVLTRTSSGGACVNDVIWHCGWEGLPFGGVGNSGIGNYHGKYSVETFTHKKAVLSRGISALAEKLGDARYPPYTESKLKFFSRVINNLHVFEIGSCAWLTHFGAALFGAAVLFLVCASTGWNPPKL